MWIYIYIYIFKKYLYNIYQLIVYTNIICVYVSKYVYIHVYTYNSLRLSCYSNAQLYFFFSSYEVRPACLLAGFALGSWSPQPDQFYPARVVAICQTLWHASDFGDTPIALVSPSTKEIGRFSQSLEREGRWAVHESPDWNLQKACLACQGSLAPSLQIGSAQVNFVGMYSQKRTASSAKSTMWINWAILSRFIAPLLAHQNVHIVDKPKSSTSSKNCLLFWWGHGQSSASLAALSSGNLVPASQTACPGCLPQTLHAVEVKRHTESGSLLTLCALRLVLRRRQQTTRDQA